MKTFTTYAEKKAKQFLNLLQGYTKGIRLTAILILLLMGVNNAWGNVVSSPRIYYDNTNTSYEKVAFMVGHNSYSRAYKLTKIENTNLWYRYLSGTGNDYWGDATQIAIFGVDWDNAENNNISHRANYTNNNYTTTRTLSNTSGSCNSLDYGNTYLVRSDGNKSTTYIEYQSSGYTALNSQQEIKTVVDGTVANSKATIDITSYEMTDNGKATKKTASVGTGASSSYISAARTATTTLTVGTVATGYQFDGWYAAKTGGTALSTSTTYTYYPTAATTVYARFSTKQHTVLFGKQGNGTITAKVGSTSITSGDKVNYGSTIVFTAKPADGYQIEGWYSNSACTTPIDNGTNDTYSVKVTTGTNVYVKFEAIPTNSHNITYTAEGTGWTYGNSNPTTAEEGATVTFVVNPTAGYRVSVSSDGPALTGPNANNQYTFTMPTKDVKITVDAKPEQYTITLNDNGGSDGSGTVTVTYLAAMPTITPPTRTGYTFNGYFDATSGGTKYYNANGSSAKNWDKTSNTTLYAQWTANKYTVTFNENGGTGTMSNQSFEYDETKPLTANAFTRKGYEFTGWNTQANGSGDSYSDKESVSNLSATNGATVNLYAQWDQLPPTTVYFKPKTEWEDKNPVIICDGTTTAVTAYDCNGEYYTAEVPGGTTNLKFGGNNEQTLPLTVPADNKVLYDMTETKITALYLKPGEWDKDGAWFAVYLCNGTDASSWHKMTKIEGTDLYGVEIESSKLNSTKNKNVIFVRMDKNKSELNWSSKWNQSKDLNMPTDGTNQCTISDYWNNGNASGSWHKVWDNSCWKEFTTPTYDITINITGKGSIVVGDTKYTGDKEGKTTLIKTGVALNTSIAIGAKTPADRWSYKEGKITIGKNSEETLGASHVICGPTTINVTFEQSNCKVTFDLNGGTGNQPAPQEVIKGGKVTQPTPDPTRDGYNFDGWYKEPACTNAWNFSTDVVNQDITLYAKWEENLSTITIKTSPAGAGALKVDGNNFTAGNTTTVGITTSRTVVASNTDGFTFKEWRKSDNITITEGSLTSPSITIKGNGNGGAGTLTAVYDEDLSTPYVFMGGTAFGGDNWVTEYPLTKRPGESDKKIGYVTFNITGINSNGGNKAYQFKIKKGSTWYGLPADGNWWYKREHSTEAMSLSSTAGDIGLITDMAGAYTIKVDYTNENDPKLTVSYPSTEFYLLGFGNADSYWEEDESKKFSVDAGIATITKTLTAGTHEFKIEEKVNTNEIWRTSSTTITRASNTNIDFSNTTSGADNAKITADVAGTYTFTYDIVNQKLAVIYPSKLTLTDGPATSVSSAMTSNPLTTVPGQMVTATPTMDIGANGNTLCWKLYDKDQNINNLDETVDVNFISLGNGKITFELPKVTGTYYLQLTIHAGADCSDETLIETIICPINVSTENTVFFQDESGKWKNVYVYFYGENGYWGTGSDWDKGSGAREVNSYKMTKINGTNIFYYKYSFAISSKNIAFTDHNQGNGQGDDGHGYQWFSSCQVVYRSDFASCAPMFVLDKNNGVNHNTTAYYYTDGYWTTYMGTSSGYWLHIDGNGVADPSHEMTTTTVGKRVYTHKVSLNGNQNPYNLWFGGCNGTNYGVESNMTVTNCTEWNLYAGPASVNLHATASGDYTFILYCNPDGHFQLSVEFPVAKGDFQLIYDDEQQNPHPSDYIRSSTVDGKLDTVSMYIRGEHGTGKTLKVQRCTGFSNNGNPQWETLETYDDAKFSGLNLTKDTVYNFHMKQTVSGNTKTIAIEGTEFYSGKYYVRTKAADGGWDAYATEADNQMTYTEYSSHLPFDPYTHYFCKWVDDSNKDDVSYTVACDYAKALSDTLEGDNYTTTPESHALPEKANVRFTYDNRTNGLKRAYLTGASDSDFDDFLKLAKTKDGTTMKPGKNASDVSHVKLQDEENWVYATEIYVTSRGSFDAMLTAVYPKSAVDNPAKKQYFFAKKNNDGTYAGETLMTGTDGSEQLVTIRYDFKTNRLMRAWKPSGEIDDEELPLSADILLIREGQNAAEQLVFTDPATNKITNVKTIFGALEFKYNNMVGKLGTGDWNQTSYHYCRYYVSFPFDVRISEIFGAGNYGEDYIIQKYNGTKRAEIGWFAETETFWETMDKSEKLNKYEGYCVMLNRTPFNDGNSNVWKNKKSGSSVYLYFPSASHKEDWTINIGDVVIAIPEHKCNIDRYFTQDVQNGKPYPRNHKNTDSHWNMVGTPLFQNATAAKIADGPEVEVSDEHPEKGTRLKYVYDWVNTADIPNGTAARKAWGTDFEFKAMHSYLIQFAGEVSFQGSHIANHVPTAIAARRVAEEVKNYTVELQLDRDSAFASRTYVELQENAEDGFLLNEDMYMGSSSPIANLYTYAGAYDVAANVLSVNSHIVPVGVQVKQAGTYTFSMTTPFDGTVTLIDYHTGARTNLGWSDYTITLEKGTLNDRFALEINIQHVSTDVEGNTGNFKGKENVKFLHNGILYIKSGDVIYDARGRKVSMSYEL